MFSDYLKLNHWNLIKKSSKLPFFDKSLIHTNKYVICNNGNKSLIIYNIFPGDMLYNKTFNTHSIHIHVSDVFIVVFAADKLYIYKLEMDELELIKKYILKCNNQIYAPQFISNGNDMVCINNCNVVIINIQKSLKQNVVGKIDNFNNNNSFVSVKLNESNVIFHQSTNINVSKTHLCLLKFDGEKYILSQKTILNSFTNYNICFTHNDNYIICAIGSISILFDYNMTIIKHIPLCSSLQELSLFSNNDYFYRERAVSFIRNVHNNDVVGPFESDIKIMYTSKHKLIYYNNNHFYECSNYNNIFKLIFWKAKKDLHKLINLLPYEILLIIQHMCIGSNYTI